MNHESFRPGLYTHYKGSYYRALFLGRHHETRELLVAYVPYDHPESEVQFREWATPGKDSWTDRVEVEIDGDAVSRRTVFISRFEWLGP